MKLTVNNFNDFMMNLMSLLYERCKEANDKGRLKEYVVDIAGESVLNSDCGVYFVESKQKILVLGEIRISEDLLYDVANDHCIDREHIDVVRDYSKIPNFDFDKLVESRKYSDIIIGAIPHSMKGTKGSSSVIAQVIHNREKYPTVIVARAGNEIKITKNSFTRALEQTNLYRWILM